MTDLEILRDRYQSRDMSQDGVEDEPPKCKCGNLITIADHGYTCRECRRAVIK